MFKGLLVPAGSDRRLGLSHLALAIRSRGRLYAAVLGSVVVARNREYSLDTCSLPLLGDWGNTEFSIDKGEVKVHGIAEVHKCERPRGRNVVA